MTNTDIIKGSKLMVFLDGEAIAFATSHSLSLTMNTSEVSTKDHGDSPAIVPQSISWEMTTENLYSDSGKDALFNAMKTMQTVDIAFVSSTYANDTAEKGIVGVQGAQGWGTEETIASGKAYITSLSVNAPAGDNATLSATFTGNGGLTEFESTGTTGTQGVQGN